MRGAKASAAGGAGTSVRVLAIDPGSRSTGYAVIDTTGNSTEVVDQGVVRLPKESSVAERLCSLSDRLRELCERHVPDEVVLEEVFAGRNVRSALILGQVRGAVIVSVGQHRPVFEYSARAVKKAVVGYGQADKSQVAKMVTTLLQLSRKPAQDAADALALALCHVHSRRFFARVEELPR